jgi:hypothetical protein
MGNLPRRRRVKRRVKLSNLDEDCLEREIRELLKEDN